MAEWAHYSTPDPEYQAALAKLLGPQSEEGGRSSSVSLLPLDLRKLRAGSASSLKLRLETADYPREFEIHASHSHHNAALSFNWRLCLLTEAAGTGLTVEEKLVPVSAPTGQITARVYTPEGGEAGETFPVLFDLHGTASSSS